MGFFGLFKQPDINQGVKEFKQREGAILLDVRTPQEYREGHIPESRNLPLQTIDKVASVVDNQDRPLFVYCYSGARSAQAAALLRRMGYSNVTDIGGIAAYRGELEV